MAERGRNGGEREKWRINGGEGEIAERKKRRREGATTERKKRRRVRNDGERFTD